jgi:hypothetical protein
MRFIKRVTVFTFAVLALILANLVEAAAFGQPPKDSIVIRSISVETDKLTAGRVPIAIQLLNVDKKAVTAFQLSLSVQYKDGTRKNYVQAQDMLASYAIAAVLPPSSQFNGKFLRPGESRQVHMSVETGPANTSPIAAEATVSMIVFDDGTAIGSPSNIQHTFLDARRKDSEMYADVVADLKHAAAAPDPATLLDKRIKELQQAEPRSGPYARRASFLQAALPAIRKSKKSLDTEIAIYESLAQTLKQHSTMKGGAR